jgi:hypothetical protein
MATFRFTGRVLPTFKEFTMIGSITAHWDEPMIDADPSVGLLMDATLSITKGVVETICESNLFGTDNYDGQVHLRANDLARTAVNSYAFGKGMGLSVILETMIKPDGVKYNIQAHQPELEPLVTVLRSGPNGGIDIQAILPVILTDPTIGVALNDLIGSVTQIQEAAVRCGRAIDAIRHAMAPDNDRRRGWVAMRENLNIDQKYLEFITDESKGPRHGDVKRTTFQATRETLKRSWVVMNRFLEFKKRRSQRLPLAEFPLLEN